jgi:hypothetical protein
VDRTQGSAIKSPTYAQCGCECILSDGPPIRTDSGLRFQKLSPSKQLLGFGLVWFSNLKYAQCAGLCAELAHNRAFQAGHMRARAQKYCSALGVLLPHLEIQH